MKPRQPEIRKYDKVPNPAVLLEDERRCNESLLPSYPWFAGKRAFLCPSFSFSLDISANLTSLKPMMNLNFERNLWSCR